MSRKDVPAHDQKVTLRYTVHYPCHPDRKSDPRYKAFNAYRRRTQPTAKCAIGEHRDDYSECAGELNLHHSHVEFSMQNGIEIAWLAKDFPEVIDDATAADWVESPANLIWLCNQHHIGSRGIHRLSAADFEAQKYVRNMVSVKVSTKTQLATLRHRLAARLMRFTKR